MFAAVETHPSSTTIGFAHKSEIRNPKLETNPKHEGTNDRNPLPGAGFGALGHVIFGVISGFALRPALREDLADRCLVVVSKCGRAVEAFCGNLDTKEP